MNFLEQVGNTGEPDKLDKTITNLMAVGIRKDLAEKALHAGFNLTKIKNATKSDLLDHFSNEEVETLHSHTKRKPIAVDVVDRLMSECHWRYCICWKYDLIQPVVIHHIVEHAKTQDDSYDNLIVLCPNHHTLAHTKSDIAQPPLPSELLRKIKADFVEALSRMVAGIGVAPGRETHSQEIAHIEASVAIDNFRLHRVRRIAQGDTFVPLVTTPKMIFHLAPLDAFSSGRNLDLKSVYNCPPQGCREWGTSCRFNHDGILYSDERRRIPEMPVEPGYSYIQIFKNGVLEGVDAYPFSASDNTANGMYIVDQMMRYSKALLSTISALGASPPGLLLISFVGVKGYKITSSSMFPSERFGSFIDRDELLIEPIDLTFFDFADEVSLAAALRPAADGLWQASGFPGARNYDQSGDWIETNQRRSYH